MSIGRALPYSNQVMSFGRVTHTLAYKMPICSLSRPVIGQFLVKGACLVSLGLAHSGCSPVASAEHQCVNVAAQIDREG